MIPSKYLFPVIALVLAWTISLYSVYQIGKRRLTNKQSPTHQLTTYNNLVATLETLNESSTIRFTNKLREKASGQYDPILPVIHQNIELAHDFRLQIAEAKEEMEVKAYQKTIAHQRLTDLVDSSGTVLAKTMQNNHVLLNKFGEQFHMHPEDIEQHTKRSLEANKSLDLQHYKNTLPQDLHSFKQQLALLELTILQFIYQQQNELISLSDGFTIHCQFGQNYYPLPNNTTLQQGQYTPVSFRMWQPPAHPIYTVRLVSNGDTITPSSSGFFELPFDVSRSGHQSESITLIETNPLTGLSSSWEFEQHYYVAPE